MNAKKLMGAVAFSLLATAGVASAQSNMVNVSTTQAGNPSSGQNGATIATVTLSATQSGSAGDVSISSIPITLSTGNGAVASNLTSCQLYNASGNSLTTGSNSIGTAGSSNTFTFNSPLSINGGQSATLTVRCDVASSLPSGGTFQFSAGMPSFTTNTNAAALGINLYVSPNVRPGAQDTLFGLLTLSGTRSNVATQISSIPLVVTFANGAQVGHLSDCRVRNLSNLLAPLNNGGNAVGIVSGSNTIPLDSALQVSSGASQTLAITCDVSAAAPIGGTVAMSINPANFAATVVGSGTAVTPTTGLNASGQLGSIAGTAVFSSVSTPPTVPGVPNTGSGAAGNLLLLAMAGFVAVGGIILARRIALAR